MVCYVSVILHFYEVMPLKNDKQERGMPTFI